MWFYAGDPVTLTVDFTVDGEFVIPTSASYLLRDHTGIAVGSSVALPTTSTSAEISVPSLDNVIGASSLFENRFIVVVFTHAGRTYTKSVSYKLTRFVPMSATPADVRRLVGVSENELPDQDIDLHTAYFYLFDAYSTTFSNQLVSTDFRGRQANEAIALQAALDVVASFPLRVPVSAKNENDQFNRISALDFRALEADLRRKLQQTLSAVLSVEETTVEVFSVSSPTDPVTGE